MSEANCVHRLVSLFFFMPINTTTEQNREIKAAQSSDHVSNLVAIIEDLDAQLSAWKDAADCSEPSELKSKLERMDKTLDSLSC